MAADLLLQHRALTSFLGHVGGVLARTQDSPAQRIRQLMDPFRHLLMEDFLGPAFKEVSADEFRQYLLYRSSDQSLSLVAQVIAPGVTMPAHDHPAWGLKGVYQGTQRETAYRREDDGTQPERAVLARGKRQRLRPGDVTGIVPPAVDIHTVEATSKVPSISIMLMGADVGCQDRNAYDVRSGAVRRFRFGYANVGCGDAKDDMTA